MPKPKASDQTPARLSSNGIERRILVLHGERVILDADLAVLYEVPTKALNQAIKRNPDRFPKDFMLRLTPEEWVILRSQSVTSSPGWGGRRSPPLAFTEQGIAMLSSVLNSDRAIQVNIEIMRVFVRLRHALEANADLARRIAHAESRLDGHDSALKTQEGWIEQAFGEIDRLLAPPAPVPPKPPIGFRTDQKAPTAPKGKATPRARVHAKG